MIKNKTRPMTLEEIKKKKGRTNWALLMLEEKNPNNKINQKKGWRD